MKLPPMMGSGERGIPFSAGHAIHLGGSSDVS